MTLIQNVNAGWYIDGPLNLIKHIVEHGFIFGIRVGGLAQMSAERATTTILLSVSMVGR